MTKKQQRRFHYISRPLKVTGFILMWFAAFMLLNVLLAVSIHAYFQN